MAPLMNTLTIDTVPIDTEAVEYQTTGVFYRILRNSLHFYQQISANTT